MTDKRELLELAARAAGYESLGYTENGLKVANPALECGFDYWDPTSDDGDCARLEAACSIDVYWHRERVFAGPGISSNNCLSELYSDHNNDRQAARRLASTRAAAEVGKGMT
jgi:hypothetical protein